MRVLHESTPLEDSIIGRAQDGTFYVSNGETWTPVPDSIQRELDIEYDNQQRLQRARNLNIDLSDADNKDKKRFKLKDKMEIEAIKKEEERQIKADYYRRLQEQQLEEEKEREIEATKIRSSQDIAYLKERLGQEIHDFLANQLYEAPEDRYDYSWDEPDPYETVDPDIFTQSWLPIYDDNPKQDTEEKEKPLALFYFDRSGSFGERSYPEKTQLGKDLITMFETDFKKELTVEYMYFSNNVHNTAAAAEDEGGTEYQPVMEDILKKTKGKISNIIILTDSDALGQKMPEVVIEGSVWLVFAGSYDGGNLARHFKLTGDKSQLKQFYFERIN